jgi:protein transport protein SEC61 subunit beta
VNTPSTGATTARPTSPKAPGGPATAIRRKAASDFKEKAANARPSSTRAAGAGGSSSTMLSMFYLSLLGVECLDLVVDI